MFIEIDLFGFLYFMNNLCFYVENLLEWESWNILCVIVVYIDYQLIKENNELKQADTIKTEQINALQLVHKDELKKHTQVLSEKSALVENMRSQIAKMEAAQKVKLSLNYLYRLINF